MNRRCDMSANEVPFHPCHNVSKVNNYKSKYVLQHRNLAHTEQKAIIKGPNMTSVNQVKQENLRSNLNKTEK